MQTASRELEPKSAAGQTPDCTFTSVAKLPVQVAVCLGKKRMTLKDLCHLVPGAVIALETPVDAQQTLVVDNLLLATGEIVRSGNQIGFRVGRLAKSREQ